eukprot:9209698-Ditylum_brightwellii.AAC.1
METEEINCGSNDDLIQYDTETPTAEPHQKPIAIVSKTLFKFNNQSKNVATASQDPSATSSIESVTLFTSCFTANDDTILTKNNKMRLAWVLK